MNHHHKPVLLAQTIALLAPQPGESYLDATAGYGGHATEVMNAIGGEASVVLVDRDAAAVNYLQEHFGSRARILHSDFLAAAKQLANDGEHFDMILADLGVSSPQLDQPERGFSFAADGSLDMRMDERLAESAADLVNTAGEERLANIIYQYGEERYSRRIARAIVAARPLATTKQLADVVSRAVPKQPKLKIHPATKTFQALRIAVNDELRQLEQSLPLFTELLKPGGRLAVISFHSLEDRLVKQWFDRESRDCICPPEQPVCICEHTATVERLTKKPVSGTLDSYNPRARSAKLRAVRKIKNIKQKEVL